MAAAILVLVISIAAVAAGWTLVRTGRRMAGFVTTRGRVTGREVGQLLNAREGRWGKGGSHYPKVTYQYTVDAITYTSDRWRYTTPGYKLSVVRQMLDAWPDDVEVHYNPANPQEAYLETTTPRWGYVLVMFGVVGVLASAAVIFS